MTKTTGNFTDFLDFSRASTATYLGSDGLIQTASNNVPRVEYDASGNVKGLLIEEARTNLVTRSEVTATSGSGWSDSGSSSTNLSENALGMFQGVSVASGGQGWHRTSTTCTVTSGTDYAATVFYRAGTSNRLRIVLRDGSGATESRVGGEIGSLVVNESNAGTASILSEEDLPDNVKKITIKYTPNFSGNLGLGIGPDSNTSGETVIAYGAQLEAGSFATSYIPTLGATATRSLDVASIDVSNFGYNQSEGTVVVDYQGLTATPNANVRILEISDGTNNNRLTLFYNATTDTVNLFSVADGDFNLTGSVSISDPNRQGIVAGAYSPDGIFLCKDGGAVSSDTSIPTLKGLDTVNIGLSYGLNDQLNGHIKSFQYYPRRLTNAQLQELTS